MRFPQVTMMMVNGTQGNNYLLDQNNIAHGILVVTRKYGGVKLSRQRCDLIKQVTAEALCKN